jgi:hypothetical protein
LVIVSNDIEHQKKDATELIHLMMNLISKKHLGKVFVLIVVLASNLENVFSFSSNPFLNYTASKEPHKDSLYYLPPFSLKNPDYVKSPYTGMTREEWIRCGIHILEGAFQYVDDIKTPMFLPKFPGKSYPLEGNAEASPERRSAAIFEAIARTFNVAAPILANNPDLTIKGIRLIDYYKFHLLELLTNPKCDYYIGNPKASPFQPTCELGNLSLWNLVAPEVFWNRLSKEEKEKVAQKVYEWATSWTCTHNWRYFNVMMLSFLDYYGYKSDKTLMLSHLDNLLMHYVGDGWYRDHSYDYYTVHVFQLYNSVWVEKYGKKYAPERVEIIKKQQAAFYETYPLIFSRKGEVNMYGRSILYRLGASAALPAAFLGGGLSAIKPGEARRVASSALLQFVTHPSFFNQGIPSLGFYGPFESCIQGYSCSASPYWMFLCYIALTLPKDHPFWTDTEEMGHWGSIKENEVFSKYSSGMGILISNHGPSGTSEIRPGKIHNQDPNYCRLVYNTAFPWEADRKDGITSSDLSVLIINHDDKAQLPAHVDAAGYHDNVLYRQAVYAYNVINLPCFIDMASIIIPGGEIRIERIRKIRKSKYYLGHFSLPHLNGIPVIIKKVINGKSCIIAKIPGRQLAITNFMGWQKLDTLENTGLHPECNKSTLLYAEYEDLEYEYGPVEILISVLLHKTDDSNWDNNTLQPIEKVEPLKKGIPIHLGGMIVTLKNKRQYTVDFGNMDGMSTRD